MFFLGYPATRDRRGQLGLQSSKRILRSDLGMSEYEPNGSDFYGR
jgi:hypothetical protein